MSTKKAIIDNALFKQIVAIRTDSLWNMIGRYAEGYLPGIYDEGASGKFDNKGAIFIPGGFIFADVDQQPISYDRDGDIATNVFKEKVRSAMQNDNATLLYPDGMATGINLDSGFFSRAAHRIFTYKKAAFRRIKRIGSVRPLNITPEDIIRSHCPPYMPTPYGARTRISACAAVSLIEPPMFFAYCKAEFNLTQEQAQAFSNSIDAAQDICVSSDGDTLYPPYLVVCHDTRYKENAYTGLTRILGIGKFGEFATFSLERINKNLTGELKRKNQEYGPEDIFAHYAGLSFLGILRIYATTNPGKRSQNYSLHIVSPSKDLDLDVDQVLEEARKRYAIP